MKHIFRYFIAWLIMPILAIRHKIKKVNYYYVISERYKSIKCDDYIEANAVLTALANLNDYGDYLQLIEVYRNDFEKILWSRRW